MPDSEILITEIKGPIATLTLNRPDQYNALSDQMLDAVISSLDDIGRDESVRAVILGANGKAFCAGHDLKQMRQSAEKAEHHRLFSKCSQMMLKIMIALGHRIWGIRHKCQTPR